MNQQISLEYPVTKQRVSQSAYMDGTVIKYQNGMIPSESKQTLEMIRNRKGKLLKGGVR